MTGEHPSAAEPPVASVVGHDVLPSGMDILAGIERRFAGQEPRATPWGASSPTEALDLALDPASDWKVLERQIRSAPYSLMGVGDPAGRPNTIDFHAYHRDDAAMAICFDPFEIRGSAGVRSATLVWWHVLRPDQRHTLMAAAFVTAVIAPTPIALLAEVARRGRSDDDSAPLWRYNTPTLLEAVTASATGADADALRTMEALGAFS